MIGELIATGVTFGVGRNSINDQFSGTAEFNNIILESGANFSGGTGGGIIYSGGTNLYNIFQPFGVGVQSIAPGTNMTTGGTETNPTISLSSEISLAGGVRTIGGFSGGQDSDVTSYLGRSVIGFGRFSDFAWFSHVDSNTSSGYALIQGLDGSTTINATLSGTGIGFRLDNGATDMIRISGNTGYVGIFNNSPTERLDVTGNVKISGTITATTASATTIVASQLDMYPQTVLPTAKTGRMFFSGTPLNRMMYNTGGTDADWIII